MKLIETKTQKLVKSKNYNYIFNKQNGYFARWGKTKSDDPQMAPSPEILDIEISTSCHGINNKPCSWCYKSNNPCGTYMSFEKFKDIFAKIPKTVTQVAFGVGDVDANPDIWKIMKHCRDNGVVPNITINGDRMKKSDYDNLAKYCGSVAISHYGDDKICFNAIKELSKRGMTQLNIHKMLCKESIKDCMRLISIAKTIKGLNAIVFLYLKPKGKRNQFHKIPSFKPFQKLIKTALTNKVNIGMDSCSAPLMLEYINIEKKKVLDKLNKTKDKKFLFDLLNLNKMEQCIEPCESFGKFSAYINVEGEYFPCSFCEGHKDFKQGINVLKIKNFDEIWYSKKVNKYRNLMNKRFKKGNYSCPIYNLKPA